MTILETIDDRIQEAWENLIDPRERFNDSPGFGWLARRWGLYTQIDYRAEGRHVPVYENEFDLKAIRWAAWLMAEEVPTAKALKNRLAEYTIGAGFDWTIEHEDEKIAKLCKRIVDKFLQNSDWTELERQSFEAEVVDGEFIAAINSSEGDLCLEQFQGDCLTEPLGYRDLEDWKGYEFECSWSFGVLTKKHSVKPIAYHLVRDATGNDWDLIDENRVAHWKRNVPRAAKRGFSDYYAPHRLIGHGAKVLDRTAIGTAIQASIAYIVEHAPGVSNEKIARFVNSRPNVVQQPTPLGGEGRSRKIEAGQIIDTPNGATYKSGLLGSTASNIYVEVMEACMRVVGAVYGFPEHFLTGYAGNNNLASSLTAQDPFVQGRFADQQLRADRMEKLLIKAIRVGLGFVRNLSHDVEEIMRGIKVTCQPPKIIAQSDNSAITTALVSQLEAKLVDIKTARQQLGYDNETIEAGLREMAEQQPEPDATAGQGGLANVGRRQFQNSKKAISDILGDLKAGDIDQAHAGVLLKELGLTKAAVDKLLSPAGQSLIEEALDESIGQRLFEEVSDVDFTKFAWYKTKMAGISGGDSNTAGYSLKTLMKIVSGSQTLTPSQKSEIAKTALDTFTSKHSFDDNIHIDKRPLESWQSLANSSPAPAAKPVSLNLKHELWPDDATTTFFKNQVDKLEAAIASGDSEAKANALNEMDAVAQATTHPMGKYLGPAIKQAYAAHVADPANARDMQALVAEGLKGKFAKHVSSDPKPKEMGGIFDQLNDPKEAATAEKEPTQKSKFDEKYKELHAMADYDIEQYATKDPEFFAKVKDSWKGVVSGDDLIPGLNKDESMVLAKSIVDKLNKHSTTQEPQEPKLSDAYYSKLDKKLSSIDDHGVAGNWSILADEAQAADWMQKSVGNGTMIPGLTDTEAKHYADTIKAQTASWFNSPDGQKYLKTASNGGDVSKALGIKQPASMDVMASIDDELGNNVANNAQQASVATAKGFDESKHPRGPDGKFIDAGVDMSDWPDDGYWNWAKKKVSEGEKWAAQGKWDMVADMDKGWGDAPTKFVDAMTLAKTNLMKLKPAYDALKNKTKGATVENDAEGTPVTQATKSWVKIGEKLGTEEGGTYLGPDGQKYYVKHPENPARAKNEMLAFSLYQACNVQTSGAQLLEIDGKLATATKWMEGSSKANFNDPKIKELASKDFAVHAWLNNWDVVGAGSENPEANMLLDGKGGLAVVDAGGAIDFKGMGGAGKKQFGPVAEEWDTLRDPSINPSAAKAFGSMTPEQLVDSAKKLEAITDDQIKEMVNKYRPGDDHIAAILIARKKSILSKAAVLQKNIDSWKPTEPSQMAASSAALAAAAEKNTDTKADSATAKVAVPPPPIISGVNKNEQKKFDTIYNLALAGDVGALEAHVVTGSNSYAKKAKKYQASVIAAMKSGGVVVAPVAPPPAATGKPVADAPLKAAKIAKKVKPGLLPPDPTFAGSHAAENDKVVAEIKKLAVAGDLEALKAMQLAPSPKLQSYHASVIANVDDQLNTPEPEPLSDEVKKFFATVPAKTYGNTKIGEWCLITTHANPPKKIANMGWTTGGEGQYDGPDADSLTPQQAAKKFWDAGTQAVNAAGKQAKSALDSYTGNGYQDINSSLRSGSPTAKAKTAAAAVMKYAIPLKQGSVISRNHSGDMSSLKPGMIVQDRGLLSTSTDPNVFSGHKNHWAMTVGEGVKGLPVWGNVGLSGEYEIIMPPNTRIMVTKVTPNSKGGQDIEAILLPTLENQWP